MIVYGANIKPLTGELTVTYTSMMLDSIDWSYANNTFYTAENYPSTYGNYTRNMCSHYKTVYVSASAEMPDKSIRIYANRIYVKDSAYTDPTAFKTAMDGVQLVYELATPVTYQLTPTEIRSLLGTNNVWADCGSITELKYTRDLNLCINDIISRIEVLEGASNTRSLSVSPVLTKSLTSDSDTAEGILEGKTEETEEETKEEEQKNER